MQVHIIPLLVILILAILGLWANRQLVSPPLQRWVAVGIVVVAVLFALVSLGLLGSTGVTVGP